MVSPLQAFVETTIFPDLTSLWDGRPTFAIFVTIFAVAITSIIYVLYLHPLFVSPLRHLPGPPLLYNPLGNFLDLVVAEPGTVSTAWADKHGPVVKIVGPFGVSSLFLFRPEALRKILITDAEDYPRPRLARDVLRLTTGYGLLATAGAEHSALRKLVSPAFSISNVNSQNDIYFKYINELVPDMLQQLETEPHGKVVYTSQWVGNLTLQIISETAFGYLTDSGKESHVEIMEAYDAMAALQSGTTISMMFALMGIPGMSAFTRSKLGLKLHWVFQAIPLLAPASTLVRYAHRLREVSARILRDRIKESELHPEDFEDKKDVMSQLLRGRNALEIKDGQRMTDGDIVEHVMTFMGAGQETTASGISWTLWFLATNRDVQQKLREEVTPIFEAGPCPDYKEFKDLKMLDCVVMESLRLLPPAPISVRQATKDDHIDGTFVPKGTLLYIPTRSIHMWKEVWGSDAEDFRPERWLDLPPNYDSSLSFLAFLAGPSGCIGKVMAMSEMKAILAALITNFDFSPAFEGQGIKPSSAITMNPKDNMPLLIKPVRRT